MKSPYIPNLNENDGEIVVFRYKWLHDSIDIRANILSLKT